jgi:hypothetical protein
LRFSTASQTTCKFNVLHTMPRAELFRRFGQGYTIHPYSSSWLGSTRWVGLFGFSTLQFIKPLSLLKTFTYHADHHKMFTSMPSLHLLPRLSDASPKNIHSLGKVRYIGGRREENFVSSANCTETYRLLPIIKPGKIADNQHDNA